ncbi:MAG: hypothetical protein WCI30_06130 [Clostridia bacterium]
MGNGDLIELLGSVTAISFGLAILNFFVKRINRMFISKLGAEQKPLADLYRKLMRLVVKYHKLVGTIAVVAVLLHFYIAYTANNIRIDGIIAGVMMTVIFLLGFYGAFINKNYKGIWLKIHRVIPFALALAIGIHVI